MKNEWAQMTGLRRMELHPCGIEEPKPDEITVRIEYVGICGSDMHFFTEGKIGRKVIDRPFVLGHECAGTVVKTGAQVKGIEAGDRVALEPGVPCGRCEFCLSGRYNLCPDVRFMASPPNDGAMRRYLNYPAFMAFRLPEQVSTLEGAMIEPLAVGMYAAKRGEIGPGKTAAILGGGPIGMMTLLACKAMGAAKILVTDLYDKRLKKALALGADGAYNVKTCDAVQMVLDETAGQGADVVFETAGSPVTMAQTPEFVKRGGVIVGVGNVTDKTSFDFLRIANREVEIRPIYRYRNIFPVVIDALASGRIDLAKIEPSIFPFEKSEEAFLYTHDHAQDIIKSVIEIKTEE